VTCRIIAKFGAHAFLQGRSTQPFAVLCRASPLFCRTLLKELVGAPDNVNMTAFPGYLQYVPAGAPQ
jgi:hypothetical protein